MLAVYDPATQQVMLVPSSSIIGGMASPGQHQLPSVAPLQLMGSRMGLEGFGGAQAAIPGPQGYDNSHPLRKITSAFTMWPGAARPFQPSPQAPSTAITTGGMEQPWSSGAPQEGSAEPANSESENKEPRSAEPRTRAGKRALEQISDTDDDSAPDAPEPAQKRGRSNKRVDPKERNRQAQRKFRARQKVLIADLQQQLEVMTNQAIRHEQEICSLRSENSGLMRQLIQCGTSPRCVTAGVPVASADSGSPQIPVPECLHTTTSNGSSLGSLPVFQAGQYQIAHFMPHDAAQLFWTMPQGAVMGNTA